MKTALIISSTALAMLSACATVQEPAPVEQAIVVEPVPLRTCSFETELTKVVVPAEYREGFTVNTVESPPEYVTDPETGEVREVTTQAPGVRVPYKILVKEEEIYFVNAESERVTDICGDDVPLNAVKAPIEIVDEVVVTPAG